MKPLKELTIEKTYSNEEASFHTIFHYRVSEEAGLGGGDTYIKIELQHTNEIKDLEKVHQSKAPLFYNNDAWTPELLEFATPISEAEYLANVKKT